MDTGVAVSLKPQGLKNIGKTSLLSGFRLESSSRTMSLRASLIAWIGLVLVLSLLVGSVLVYWHSVQKVDVEMHAALAVGEHTVHNAFDDAEEAANPLRQARLLVADLDGDRHLKAALFSANGTLLARSVPLESSRPAPRWFFDLLAPSPQVTRIQLPSPSGLVGTIVLETDSHNEISEVWSDVILTLTVLALFCLANAALVFWATGRALQPLGGAIHAFDRIGAGDYSVRLPAHGPLEMERVSNGLNDMVKQLAAMQRRERQLEEQLVAVQEEERAELAQDLHDEVGPLLFAVGVDLSALRTHQALQSDAPMRERLGAAQDALSRIQQHVKTMLQQLRPPTVANLGLLHSVERIVGFWRTRYPNVLFRVAVPEEPIDTDIAGRIVRIAQESISNALRHGHPTAIELEVRIEGDRTTALRITDDGSGLQADGHAGLGLRGIRHQVDSVGGSLVIAPGAGGRGVIVAVRFPPREPMQ